MSMNYNVWVSVPTLVTVSNARNESEAGTRAVEAAQQEFNKNLDNGTGFALPWPETCIGLISVEENGRYCDDD